ncbi:MAG: L,D-transpeptidase family protein [Rubellimicrobium sp.]|nr:L,D-transpeptidase family protein [Rubellimicrobium sp.]
MTAFRPSLALALSVLLAGTALPAAAQVGGFTLGVAQAAAENPDIAAFYRGRDFAGIWTGSDAAAVARRNAFLAVLGEAPLHALPAARFDAEALVARLRAATGASARGALEVEMSTLLVDWAQALQNGILDPARVYGANKREARHVDAPALLGDFAASPTPGAFLAALAPRSAEYARLMAARLDLLDVIAAGGWGPAVGAGSLAPGDHGAQVVALRDRLVAMGYLAPSVTAEYDGTIVEAVRRFQETHGLDADGVAGGSTIAALNTSPEMRLRAIIVAMERERWIGPDRGARHIWVNLADFHVRLVDDDIITFETRSVIGATSSDRQSPEFSDLMEYLVLNPSWHVPRSIVVGEYLPQLQRNPGAVSHIRVIDSQGRVVNRSTADFSQFSARSFPYSMVEPPSAGNALGVVKFMFPNPWNIYLHDTPSRSLFQREVRAFSHGCIRLQDPRDFAYALLARQSDDPEGMFNTILRTGAETRVNLEQPVPVHLDYRTAFVDPDGQVEYRADIYGRDARVWEALVGAGVAAPGVQG